MMACFAQPSMRVRYQSHGSVLGINRVAVLVLNSANRTCVMPVIQNRVSQPAHSIPQSRNAKMQLGQKVQQRHKPHTRYSYICHPVKSVNTLGRYKHVSGILPEMNHKKRAIPTVFQNICSTNLAATSGCKYTLSSATACGLFIHQNCQFPKVMGMQNERFSK